MAGAALNSWKLSKLFPSPPSGSEAAATNRQGETAVPSAILVDTVDTVSQASDLKAACMK